MRLLDRYVIRNFFEAYVYCIAGFVSIWLIYDISDNISAFLEARLHRWMILKYYLTQVPQVMIVLLPVALLLAVLFSLGRMSRTNEIVSMLTAGVSIPRMLAPLVVIGLLTTGASMTLNYALAPHAEYARKTVLEAPERTREAGVLGQIFRNRTDDRTWYVQHFTPGSNEFRTVQVLQQDANENIVANYQATTAVYHPDTHAWELREAKIVYYDSAGNIVGSEGGTKTITTWSETPYRLSSANFRPEYLSVPELVDYLRFNADFPSILLAPFRTHFYHRFALPWTCFIIVLVAAPLGIGYSRRGILSSVAAAIVLIFSMNFLTHLFLALGEGSRISPVVAAWTPNAIFAVIGILLLYFRATNREPPSLNRFALRRAYAR